jgi:hypothetical protein
MLHNVVLLLWWILIFLVAFLLLGIYSTVYGQLQRAINSGVLVDQHEVQRPTKFSAASERYIGWGKIIALRPDYFKPELGRVLSDIESQMPASHTYKSDNLITWSHETTHGINSRARMSLGASYNAFYCLNGNIAIFRTPRIRKSQIAEFLPQDIASLKVYRLYVTGQREWDDDATYIFDEWVAHINAVVAYKELRKIRAMPTNEGEFEARNAIALMVFSDAVLKATVKYDPQFVDLDVMADFVGFNIQRTIDAAGPLQPGVMGRALEIIATPDITVEWREPHDYIYDAKISRWDRKEKTIGDENQYTPYDNGIGAGSYAN